MKDKAIEWFEMLKLKFKDTEFEIYLTDAIEAFKAQKVGKWIKPHYNTYIDYVCSLCGWEAYDPLYDYCTDIKYFKYCKNCGAKMEVEDGSKMETL